MITRINSDNRENYTVLFNKASAKLGLAPIEKEVTDENGVVTVEYYRLKDGKEVKLEESDMTADHEIIVEKDGKKETLHAISSLNEYFQHIGELASLAIGDGREGSDPYFLRLPVDEPFMEIDANTRAITVPNALRQVGVVGDKLAEIVFFKIDRYFDAVDLNTRHIYIEWEDAAGNKGVSRDFLKDVQSEKDKIIFGWIIGDDLTKSAGNIRFAVRFVEWTNQEDASNSVEGDTGLLYSFSSLPATIQVVDSLHYSLFEDGEDATMIKTSEDIGTMKFFLEDSDPDVTGDTAPQLADKPVFIRDLDAFNGVNEAPTLAEEPYVANLEQENKSLEIAVEAYSPDAGTITYMFGRKAQKDSGTTGLVAKTKYLEVTDTSDKNKPLYKKAANDTYVPVAHSEVEMGETYYEKVAYAIITGPGYYFADARNRVSGKKASRAQGEVLYVPYAVKPEVTKQMDNRFVFNQVDYTESIDEDIDQSLRENAYKSNLLYTASAAGPDHIVLKPELNASDSKGQTFTYQWYKADNAEMNDAVAIDGATEPTLDVTAPGFYALKVDNYFNNDHKETEMLDAGVCRVTNMPEKLTIANWDTFTRTLVSGRQVALQVNKPAESDEATFEWHRVTSNKDLDPVAADTDFIESIPVKGTLSFGASTAAIQFAPKKAGTYYLVLTNKLNDAAITVNYGRDPEYGTIAVEAE